MEPLPEIGRSKASGSTCAGKPKKSATGAIQLVNNSNAPEALSIVTAIINPTKEGKIEMEDWKPSFAPAINVSNRGTRLKRPNTMMTQITLKE